MPLFQSYATKQQFSTYSGRALSTQPAEIEALIMRASELVKMCTGSNIDMLNAEHVELAMLATCAQVQSWLDSGNSAMIDAKVSSYSLGELSMSFAQDDVSKKKLCTLSLSYLASGFLLYKGMRW